MKPDIVMKDIAAAVKSKAELSSVVCIYSNKREISQNPVCSFTLSIGLGKSKYLKNYEGSEPEISTEFKLCLLAPFGAGGKRVSEVALWISEAIRENLSVSSIEIQEPQYNETNASLFCDIKVTVEDISVADTACSVYTDDALVQNVVSFEIESEELLEKCPSLLNGYSYENTGKNGFFIKLQTRTALKLSDTFTLKLCFENSKEIYKECKVSHVTRELSKWGNLRFSYEIKAKEVCYE